MDPFIHDPDRHLPSINRISQANTTDPNHFNTVYVPVAYNIPFNLYVYVKNETDATKIIEQILPFFKPEYTVKANMLPGIDKEERNVPFFLTGGPNFTNLYEGPYTGDKQMIVVELNFLCHAYFWGPVEPTPIIKFVKVNEHFGNSNVVIGTSTMQPGLTANGEPTSNANNSVDPLTIYVTDDYGFAEDDDDQLF